MRQTLRTSTIKWTNEPAHMGETLAALKKTLREAKDFGVPWEQFNDEVAMNFAFTEHAECKDNVRIEALLSAVVARVTGQKKGISNAAFLFLPEHRFWHGPCDFGDHTIIFFYFDDIDMGLAGIKLMTDLANSNIDLVRFSLVGLPAGAMPSNIRGQA